MHKNERMHETHSEATATRLPEGSTASDLIDTPAALATSAVNCAFPGRYLRTSESWPPESQQSFCFRESAQMNPEYMTRHSQLRRPS